MGLLSFLTRKSLGEKRQQQDRFLITQAYHSTVASDAPIRGKYPVGGNGKTDFETLTKARGLNPDQAVGILYEGSGSASVHAPPPAATLSRSASVERPSTAPNGTRFAPGSQLKKAASIEQSPLRLLRRQSLIGGPRPGSSAFSIAGSIPPIQERVFSLPEARGSQYKDILDAQSELRHLDFKSRVQATGVRDYGEDVADRNLRENGWNLDSSPVQSYYGEDLYEDALRKPGSLTNISRSFRRDANAFSRFGPGESSPRTLSLKPSTTLGPPRRGPYRLSQLPNRVQDYERRPKSSGVLSRRHSQGRNARTGHVRTSSIRSQMTCSSHHPRGSLAGSPLRLATHFPELLQDHEGPSSPEMEASPRRPQPVETSSSSTIRPVKSRKESDKKAEWVTKEDQRGYVPAPGQRSFPLVTVRCRRNTGSSVVPPAGSHLPRLSLPPTPSQSSISSSNYHTANESTSYPPSRERADPTTNSLMAIYGPAGHLAITTPEPSDEVDSAPSPVSKTNPVCNIQPNQTRSLTSSLCKLQTNDLPLSETSVIRAASLRNWSITSTTPTTSDSSSSSVDPSQRPTSRHTAQTSVDLGSAYTKNPNASRDSLGLSTNPLRRSPPASPLAPTTATFNIDDYISSDDDGLEPRRPRAEGEESLLFSSDGYGGEFMLPGLFDSLAKTPPQQPSVEDVFMRPRTSSSLPISYRPSPAKVSRRYTLDTAADSEEDEGEEDIYASFTLSGGLSPPTRRTKRFSALGHEPIAEEVEPVQLDKTNLLRIRKEAKARRRAMGLNIVRRVSRKGKGREMDYEDEQHADVEC